MLRETGKKAKGGRGGGKIKGVVFRRHRKERDDEKKREYIYIKNKPVHNRKLQNKVKGAMWKL